MECKFLLLFLFVTALFCETSQLGKKLASAKAAYKAKDLTDDELHGFAGLSDTQHFNRVLDNILVPRIVGTPQHDKVADFIVDEMSTLGWHVERSKFNDSTPIFGVLEFQNIIAKLNPDADRFLVLACHYDSKYFREHAFVAATDSAVPCSMIINLAQTLSKQLDSIKSRKSLSLQVIFFDGEEAFKTWTDKDSLYGARNLAAKMQKDVFSTSQGERVNNLERIDLLVLLDLIGAPHPRFYSFFSNTQRWFSLLSEAEERLEEMGHLREYSSREGRYFTPRTVLAEISDDHLPFLHRGVKIVHLITSPFPAVWHTEQDNRSALDFNTIENITKVLRAFLAQYLKLEL